jgi:pyridoxamine 5'-phosphate oxidase
MSDHIPSHYNNLPDAFSEAWRLLSRGVADRKSGFHHATLASIGLNGNPRLRTIILRGCEPRSWSLRFHTDVRSTKVAELRNDPRVSLQVYDPHAKIQLRLEGLASVHHQGEVAEAAWRETRAFSRQCYCIQPGPGTVIETGDNYVLPEATDEATSGGRDYFCAIVIAVTSLEWLYLASAGHRRALFRKQSEGVTSQWLAP